MSRNGPPAVELFPSSTDSPDCPGNGVSRR